MFSFYAGALGGRDIKMILSTRSPIKILESNKLDSDVRAAFEARRNITLD